MPELRCDNKFFGIISEDAIGQLEITCPSLYCKLNREVIVHIWDLGKPTENGILKPEKTLRLKRPEVKGFKK